MNINSYLLDLLSSKGKDFLTINQIRKHLSREILLLLELERKSATQKEIVTKLNPHLKEDLKILKKGNSFYISRSHTAEEMILGVLSTGSLLSSKKLRNALPFRNEEFVPALNTLLQSGRIYCELNEKTHLPCRFYLNETGVSSEVEPDSFQEEKEFREAYNLVGKGKHFVRIHQLRQHLEWEPLRFDTVIERLKTEYKIQLQSGNSSQLSGSELKDSYTDPKGRLRVTITWVEND